MGDARRKRALDPNYGNKTSTGCVANSIAGRRDDNYDVEATRETLLAKITAVFDLIDDKVFKELGYDSDLNTFIAKVIEQSETNPRIKTFLQNCSTKHSR